MANHRRDMERVTLLPLTVRYRPQERAVSLLCRLAVRRGSASLKEFLSSVPHCPAHVANSVAVGQHLDLVARMSGFPLLALESSTPIKTEAVYRIGNVLIARHGRIVSANSIGRVCTMCLREDLDLGDGPSECRPFRRFWWDLDGINGCPVHNVPLLATCPDCDAPSHQINLRPDRCACGSDLAKAAPGIQHRGFDKELVDLLLGGIPPSWAKGMPMRIIAGLALRLGMLDALGPRRLGLASILPGERMEMSNRGALILDAGRPAVIETLERGVRQSSRGSPGQLYGELYVWLLRTQDDALEPIRDVMRDHAGEALREPSGTIMFGVELQRGGAERRTAAEPDRAAFDAALDRARLRVGCRFKDLRGVLGLSSSQLNCAKEGLNDLLEGAVRFHYVTYEYDVSGVIGMMDRASTKPRYDAVPDHLIEVMKVSVFNRSWSAVYRALRECRLDVAGVLSAKIGLPALLVVAQEVVDAFPIEKPEWSEPTLSLAEARKRTGFRMATMTALRRAGKLKYAKRRASDWRTVLGPTIDSIENCERDLVTAGELQRLSGRTFYQVISIMQNAGVSWVVEGVRSAQFVFPRTEALRALSLQSAEAA